MMGAPVAAADRWAPQWPHGVCRENERHYLYYYCWCCTISEISRSVTAATLQAVPVPRATNLRPPPPASAAKLPLQKCLASSSRHLHLFMRTRTCSILLGVWSTISSHPQRTIYKMSSSQDSPFLLSGDLFKLKHKSPAFGSAWNKRFVGLPVSESILMNSCPCHYRFFVVEIRHLRKGPEAFFSYYPDEKRSNNIKEAGDSPVLLQTITHISLSAWCRPSTLANVSYEPFNTTYLVVVATSGRLPLYLAAGSRVDERLRRELQNYADVLFEVETPQRGACMSRLAIYRMAMATE